MKQFRPMLAETIEDVSIQVSFPCLASPKLDGIRCVIRGGKALSRSLKPIPNDEVRRVLEALPCLEGCDGELMVTGATFQDITSAFMNRSKKPPSGWYFAVFDHTFNPDTAYVERAKLAGVAVASAATNHVQLVPQTLVGNAADLEHYEQTVLSHGYEGVMVRRAASYYKFGRSTATDGALLKLKRFEDSEAQVIGFVELLHNDNAATRSELGLTKRSSSKAGKSSSGSLGALIVRDLKTGIEFEVGTGFTGAQRDAFWRDRVEGAAAGVTVGGVLRCIIKYKHFVTGALNKPRFPVFLGFRAPEDMS